MAGKLSDFFRKKKTEEEELGILDRYNDYVDKDLKRSSITQALMSGGQFAANEALIGDMGITKAPGMTAGNVSLNSIDVATGAKRDIDKGFNSMLKIAREGGQDVDPSMLSRYSDNISKIEGQQAAINSEIMNKEKMINFQSEEQAKQYNATKAASDAQMETQLKNNKAQARMANINDLGAGVKHISDMTSSAGANKFNFELLATEMGLNTKRPITPKAEDKSEGAGAKQTKTSKIPGMLNTPLTRMAMSGNSPISKMNPVSASASVYEPDTSIELRNPGIMGREDLLKTDDNTFDFEKNYNEATYKRAYPIIKQKYPDMSDAEVERFYKRLGPKGVAGIELLNKRSGLYNNTPSTADTNNSFKSFYNPYFY